jgi:hypothetical protein
LSNLTLRDHSSNGLDVDQSVAELMPPMSAKAPEIGGTKRLPQKREAPSLRLSA